MDRQRITIAVANGANTFRQVARDSGLGWGSAVIQGIYSLIDDDVLAFTRGTNGTLRLGPRAAVIRRNGRAVFVGRAERV